MKVQASKRRNAKATYVVWKSKDTKEESQSHQGVKEVKVPMVNAKVTIASMKVKTNEEKKILKLHVEIKIKEHIGLDLSLGYNSNFLDLWPWHLYKWASLTNIF